MNKSKCDNDYIFKQRYLRGKICGLRYIKESLKNEPKIKGISKETRFKIAFVKAKLKVQKDAKELEYFDDYYFNQLNWVFLAEEWFNGLFRYKYKSYLVQIKKIKKIKKNIIYTEAELEELK